MRFTVIAALVSAVAAQSTVTTYSTDVETITSCAASVTNCPANTAAAGWTSTGVWQSVETITGAWTSSGVYAGAGSPTWVSSLPAWSGAATGSAGWAKTVKPTGGYTAATASAVATQTITPSTGDARAVQAAGVLAGAGALVAFLL